MNEKIRELAEQATSTHTHLSPGGTFEETTRYFNKEKFAELIVAECIKQVEPTQHHEVWAQSYLGGVDGLDLLYSKIKDIKKHFGVE